MKIAKENKELEPLDIVLNKFLIVCKQACEDDRVFDSFKSHPDVHTVLEHATKSIGQKHLELIYKHNPWLLDVSKIWDNDKCGSPVLEEYKIRDNIFLRCSPTTLQYIDVVSNLINIFDSLKGWKIVEVGGGYGGQCKIVQDVFDVFSYDVIDLEEAGLLQEKYLKRLNCFDVVSIMKNTDPAAINYDLAISNYALSELTKEEQLDYIDSILLNAKHGYITCNAKLHGMELLKEKFDTFKISKDIEGERETNYLITW